MVVASFVQLDPNLFAAVSFGCGRMQSQTPYCIRSPCLLPLLWSVIVSPSLLSLTFTFKRKLQGVLVGCLSVCVLSDILSQLDWDYVFLKLS